MYAARNLASTKPLTRAGSITKSTHLPSPPPSSQPKSPAPNTNANTTTSSSVTDDRLTIAKFASLHKQNFPVKCTVCKGFYGPTEDLKFSEGDKLRAHSLKQSTVINVQYDNGARENIHANSSVPFAVLFDPHGNTKEAMMGYRFEKISELVQLPVLPPVLWSRKSYKGSSPESSVSANELLIVRRVKSRLVGRQQLKVYSHTQRKEKTLYTSCVGSFSTKPRDICLFLEDIVRHMPDIFPCRAVMLNDDAGAGTTAAPQGVSQRSGGGSGVGAGGPCVVTLLHSSIETYLTASSALKQPGSPTKFLQIPIDLGIMVKLDRSEDEQQQSTMVGDSVYEDTDLYTHLDPPSAQLSHSDAPQPQVSSQFYTNVHFGQERTQHYLQTNTFASCATAIEQGHYQTPRRDSHASSTPIDIGGAGGVLRDEATNYVLMTKSPPYEGAEEGGGRKVGSFEKTNPSSSPSYRPPLPPPNKIKREVRGKRGV